MDVAVSALCHIFCSLLVSHVLSKAFHPGLVVELLVESAVISQPDPDVQFVSVVITVADVNTGFETIPELTVPTVFATIAFWSLLVTSSV